MQKPSSFIKPIIVVQEGSSWYFYYEKKIVAKVEKVWFFYRVNLTPSKKYSLLKVSAFNVVQSYFENFILPINTPFITLSLPLNDLKRSLSRKKGL